MARIESDDSDTEDIVVAAGGTMPKQDGSVSFEELSGMELLAVDNDGNPYGQKSVHYNVTYVVAPGAPESGCDVTLAASLANTTDGIFGSWALIPYATLVWPKGSTDKSLIRAATLYESANQTMFFYIHTPNLELDCAIETSHDKVNKLVIIRASDPAGKGTADVPKEFRSDFTSVPMYRKFVLSPFAFFELSASSEYKDKYPAAKPTPKKVAKPGRQPGTPKPKPTPQLKPVTKKLALNLTKPVEQEKATPKARAPKRARALVEKPAVADTVKEPTPKVAKVEQVVDPTPPPAAVPPIAPIKSPVRWKLILEGDGIMPSAVADSFRRIWSTD